MTNDDANTDCPRCGEVCSQRFPECPDAVELPASDVTWACEFPSDFDAPAIFSACDKLEDVSWHNDVSPSFQMLDAPEEKCDGSKWDGLRLWSHHPLRSERECDNEYRFEISDYDCTVSRRTNDPAEALKFMLEEIELLRLSTIEQVQVHTPCIICGETIDQKVPNTWHPGPFPGLRCEECTTWAKVERERS